MSSKLEIAKNYFNDGLELFQELIDNKEKIKEGLEELSLGAKGHKNLFNYYFNDIYSFLEDDFGPNIREIEKEINKGKLSKRKYKILLEDSCSGENIDIFYKYLTPIKKLFNNELGLMFKITEESEKAYFGYNKLYNNLDCLHYTIYPIKDIIRYGINENIEDDKYYYFDWYNDKEIVKSLKKENSNDIIFTFKKVNKYLFIIHNSTNNKYKIKNVELDSPYDIVSQYMIKDEKNTLIRKNIEDKTNINISEGLSDTKKHIGFKKILLNVFCEGATKDKLIFYRDVKQERLNKLEISEKKIEEYLIENFGKYDG